jgi:sugar O-acyltransferase (sialic acid O-acetyltransferase NeuD family)
MSRSKRRDLVIVGASGHASDVLGLVEDLEAEGSAWRLVGLIADAPPPIPKRFADRAEFLGGIDLLGKMRAAIVLAAGYPAERKKLYERVAPYRCEFASLIHPDIRLGRGCSVEEGVVVLGGARISSLVRLGAHCYVGYLAAVGHDAVVGRFSSVMPAAVLSGNVVLGEGVLVGTNATILEKMHVGAWASVAAGTVVTHRVAARTTVAGIPARPLKKN